MILTKGEAVLLRQMHDFVHRLSSKFYRLKPRGGFRVVAESYCTITPRKFEALEKKIARQQKKIKLLKKALRHRRNLDYLRY